MDEEYYVYLHKSPLSRDGFRITYVGRGRRDRAWQCRSSQRMNPKHVEWLESHLTAGYTMGDIVEIVCKGLSKQDATNIEAELINEYDPCFNRPPGGPRQITDEEISFAFSLREKGLSYSDIADQTPYTTMTIWRALNGKLKNG